MSDDEKLVRSCLVFAIFPFYAAFVTWVVMTIWNWHLPPLGAPAITFWQAFGIKALWAAIFFQPDTMKEKYKVGELERVGAAVMMDLFALGFAWLAYVAAY